MDSLTLKSHNSFQNENNKKAIYSFATRPLIFKLQQEVLKFNDICVSWSSPKTELVTNFLNPENRSFQNVSTVTFKEIFDIHLLNNLFISFLHLFISLIELKTFLCLITYLFLILTTYLFL